MILTRPARTTPVAIAGGWSVPGNDWRLLDTLAAPGDVSVSVVVPTYVRDAHDQARLDALLEALADQTHSGPLQVVVADDGSPRRPRVPSGVCTVRQADRGFRAAAARALGTSASEGTVIAFCDADCVPHRDWVRAISRLPALAPEAMVVGTREHADAATGRRWPRPAWLDDLWARTDDLCAADEDAWRGVISAGLATSRAMLDEIGGFDPSFVGYGGEDWELAWRHWQAGGLLAHEPRAVLTHDGPDWAGREGVDARRDGAKQAEAFALLGRITTPTARPRALRCARCDLVADLTALTEPGAALLCADSLLAAVGDARVRVRPEVAREWSRAGVSDERVLTGALPQPGRWRLEVARPVRWEGLDLGAVPDTVGTVRAPDGSWTLTRVRAERRARRAGVEDLFATAEADWARPVERVDLEGWFGGWG